MIISSNKQEIKDNLLAYTMYPTDFYMEPTTYSLYIIKKECLRDYWGIITDDLLRSRLLLGMVQNLERSTSDNIFQALLTAGVIQKEAPDLGFVINKFSPPVHTNADYGDYGEDGSGLGSEPKYTLSSFNPNMNLLLTLAAIIVHNPSEDEMILQGSTLEKRIINIINDLRDIIYSKFPDITNDIRSLALTVSDTPGVFPLLDLPEQSHENPLDYLDIQDPRGLSQCKTAHSILSRLSLNAVALCGLREEALNRRQMDRRGMVAAAAESMSRDIRNVVSVIIYTFRDLLVKHPDLLTELTEAFVTVLADRERETAEADSIVTAALNEMLTNVLDLPQGSVPTNVIMATDLRGASRNLEAQDAKNISPEIMAAMTNVVDAAQGIYRNLSNQLSEYAANHRSETDARTTWVDPETVGSQEEQQEEDRENARASSSSRICFEVVDHVDVKANDNKELVDAITSLPDNAHVEYTFGATPRDATPIRLYPDTAAETSTSKKVYVNPEIPTSGLHRRITQIDDFFDDEHAVEQYLQIINNLVEQEGAPRQGYADHVSPDYADYITALGEKIEDMLSWGVSDNFGKGLRKEFGLSLEDYYNIFEPAHNSLYLRDWAMQSWLAHGIMKDLNVGIVVAEAIAFQVWLYTTPSIVDNRDGILTPVEANALAFISRDDLQSDDFHIIMPSMALPNSFFAGTGNTFIAYVEESWLGKPPRDKTRIAAGIDPGVLNAVLTYKVSRRQPFTNLAPTQQDYTLPRDHGDYVTHADYPPPVTGIPGPVFDTILEMNRNHEHRAVTFDQMLEGMRDVVAVEEPAPRRAAAIRMEVVEREPRPTRARDEITMTVRRS